MDGSKKDMSKPPHFHSKGVRWRYSDGTVLIIGPDGSARRLDGKVRMKKKERRRRQRKGHERI